MSNSNPEPTWESTIQSFMAQSRPKSVEKSGGSVNYYQVPITKPTSSSNSPYLAECNDLIEALGMSYAEANIFKAIWRICAARTLGKYKEGFEDPTYDITKINFFANRLTHLNLKDKP